MSMRNDFNRVYSGEISLIDFYKEKWNSAGAFMKLVYVLGIFSIVFWSWLFVNIEIKSEPSEKNEMSQEEYVMSIIANKCNKFAFDKYKKGESIDMRKTYENCVIHEIGLLK